jgi:hypothetical protein
MITSMVSDSFRADAFQTPGFVDNPFEETDDGCVLERAGVVDLHFLEDPPFPVRVVNGEPFLLFDFADLQGQSGPLVEDSQEFAVQAIDLDAKLLNVHGIFS